MLALAAALILASAGCSSGHGSGKASPSGQSGQSGQSAETESTAARAHDVALIESMYTNINRAFRIDPNAGVRTLIATQYPGDRADVDFARCVNELAPHAKSLPRSLVVHFAPNIAKSTLDPTYTVTSSRVSNLHPKGRIYETQVTITLGAQTSVHSRHQVVLDGKAYQFSSC